MPSVREREREREMREREKSGGGGEENDYCKTREDVAMGIIKIIIIVGPDTGIKTSGPEESNQRLKKKMLIVMFFFLR